MMSNAGSIRAGRAWRFIAAIALFVPTMFSMGDAAAAEAPISVGEVTAPPPGSGVDAIGLRAEATDEIRHIDASQIPNRRKIVVSLSLTKSAFAEKTTVCTVNAMLRDAETGVMIAIIEAGAQAEGPASVEVKKQVANAAVRSAVRRIPRALGGK
jgi:hypothetical protein